MNKTELFFDSSAPGGRIHAVFWEPEGETRALLQITHGMAEYIERYEPFAEYLTERGFAVSGHDHLGHGKSAEKPEDLGFFAEGGQGASYLLQDIKAVGLECKRRHPGLPLFLLGHSMGSFFARRTLPLYGGEYAGAIIMGTGAISSFLAHTGLTLSRMICRFKGERTVSPLLESMVLGSSVKAFQKEGPLAWLSVNPENVKKYEADPLCGFPFTAGAYRDFFSVMASVSDREGYDGIRCTLPILVISGECDPVGGKNAVEKVAQEYRRLDFTDVTAKIFPGDRHEILNENDRDEVYAFLFAWMNGRVR